MYIDKSTCQAVSVLWVKDLHTDTFGEQHVQCAQKKYAQGNLCYYHGKISQGLMRSYAGVLRIYNAESEALIQR